MLLSDYVESQDRPNVNAFLEENPYSNSHPAQLMEEYVRYWVDYLPNVSLISHREFDSLLKLPYRGVESSTGGIEIKQQEVVRMEIDLALEYRGDLYIGEVKSKCLNGYLGKIESCFSFLDQCVEEDVQGLIIYLPIFRENRRKNLEELLKPHQRAQLVDTKVKAKDFE